MKTQPIPILETKTQRLLPRCFITLKRTPVRIALRSRAIEPLNRNLCGSGRRGSIKRGAASDHTMKYEIVIDGKRRNVEIFRSADQPSRVTVNIDGRNVEADAVKIAPFGYSSIVEGRSFEVRGELEPGGLLLHIGGFEYRVEIADPRSWRRDRSAGINPSGPQRIAASMAGKVVRVLVAQGDRVESGQGLLVVEAMKMQNEIRAPKAGTVERLSAKQGKSV